MRIIAISLCAIAFATTPALAREGNPIAGVGVSVESSGAGIRVVRYNNANDARAACVAARGTFSNTARGGIRCANPRTPLAGQSITVSSSNHGTPPTVAAPSTTNPPPR